MDFPWYRVKNEDEKLTQGDIILSCPVPVLKYTENEYPYYEPKFIKQDVIVMTQACDLQNGKVRSVTLCKVGSLEEQLKKHFDNENKNNPNYNYSNVRTNTKLKYVEKIRRGSFLELYLLNKCDVDGIQFPYRLVHLRDSYRIPLKSLEKVIESTDNPTILRLLPPYREHLSHNFSFNFSRIGLPIDVSIASEDI
ncbi:hypothetical protein SIA70_13585 [Bacillus subtilis]|uniref:hypothetical protein n=1 Tax=Bacillus subtilis TaxID=1423 RepID=UPI0029C4AF48|nr:hypothetical protein [Bacillus subtilis]MDX6157139.1 hypothetical protein [Bacillus subtilis]